MTQSQDEWEHSVQRLNTWGSHSYEYPHSVSDLLNQVYGSFTGSLGTPFMLPKFYMQSDVLCEVF